MLNNFFSWMKNRPHPSFLEYPECICAITRKVIDAYNTLSEQDFLNRFSCYKSTYAKRVARYGDPYMNAPLAKLGKFLAKLNK